MIRLLKPLDYYQKKYGTWQYGLQKMYLLMEKQHNRGQEGAGLATIKLDIEPGEEYIWREREEGNNAIQQIFANINERLEKYDGKLNDAAFAKQNLPFAGELYLGHLRYSTTGKRGVSYVHPFLRRHNWKARTLVLAGNFNLTNVDEIFEKLTEQGQHPREYGGSHWCVLVSKTTPTPQPGSDEINRAYEEGWVGNHALAFIGDTLSPKGEKVPELFIVELPQDEAGWKAAGDAPLSGTETTLPAPPRGVVQRRLTFTHHRAYPGLVNVPRHWVRCNPQGTQIAFLMRDDNGIVQLWLISPQGGEPRQLTHNKTDIQSAFNWHPSGEWLGFVLDNRIACAHAQSGEVEYLTENHANPPSADAVVFSPDGQWLAWMEGGQLWITETDR